MGTLTIDARRYGRLLAKTTPKVIESPREHQRMLRQIESLMDRGEDRTAEEDALLSLLASLVEAYERSQFPIAEPSPRQALCFLMDRRGLRQADLMPIFGSSGYVSDVVNGRRAISKRHAKKLAEYFGVSADLFL